MTRDKQGNYSVINTGRKYDGRKDNVSKTLFQLARVYRAIENSDQKELKGQLHTLEKSKNIHLIKEGSTNAVTESFNLDGGQRSINAGRSSSDSQHTKTEFDFSNSTKQDFLKTEGVVNTNETIVTHEMRHQYDYEIGNMSDNAEGANERDPVEIRGVYNENLWRKANGLPNREKYGNKIDPKLLKNPPNNKNPK